MTNSYLAELKGVHKRYGPTLALDGLYLHVERRELLAVLGPNGPGKTELRVREHIHLIASCYPDPMTPHEAMRKTNTTALANRPYGKLSGGQKRQAQFAIALCGRPQLLAQSRHHGLHRLLCLRHHGSCPLRLRGHHLRGA